MRRVNEVRPSVLLAVALPIAVGAFTLSGSTVDLSAQVTPHPREMGLPTPESTRPDPSDYRNSPTASSPTSWQMPRSLS